MRSTRSDPPDDYDPYSYGNMTDDGKYMMKWGLTLLSGLILVSASAGIAWGVGESNRMSAVEAREAAIEAKLDYIIKYMERHGT